MKLAKEQIDYFKKDIRDNLSFRFYLNFRKIPISNNFISSIYSKDDKPSFLINKDDRTFHDFSNTTKSENRHGDIIKFHMDSLNVDYYHSIIDLKDTLIAQRLLRNTSNSGSKTSFKRKSKSFLKLGEAGTYEKNLNIYKTKGYDDITSHEKAFKIIVRLRRKIGIKIYAFIESFCNNEGYSKECIGYLTGKKRKLHINVIKKFRIIEIKNPFKLSACLAKRFKMHELIQSGVFNNKGNFIFCYHRILIPYIENDKIISIRGRAFPDINNKLKYLNLAGHPSQMIFNNDVIRKIKPKDKLVFCEGEFDTMIAAQMDLKAIGFPGVNGIPYERLKQLNLSQYKLYIAFDADEAGDKAAKEFCDELGVKIIRMRPIAGKDLSEVYDG